MEKKLPKRLVALIQMCSTNNAMQNLKFIQQNVEIAKQKGALMCFLPECFARLSLSQKETLDTAEILDESNIITALKAIANNNQIWLSLGGFQEKRPNHDKLFNTHLILDDKGQIVARYSKLHLFDVEVDARTTIRESAVFEYGQELPPVVDSPVGRLGLSVCYDLRFPELYRDLSERGAEILLVPSAFFKTTGAAHWHTLLTARAIENQCFVLAAAQTGHHNPKRESYGHSLVINPWGTKLLDMGATETGVQLVELDLDEIQKTRARLPSFYHRRLVNEYKLNLKPKY